MTTDYTNPKLTRVQKELLVAIYSISGDVSKVRQYKDWDKYVYVSKCEIITTSGDVVGVDAKTYTQLANKFLVRDGRVTGEDWSNIGTIVCEKLFGKAN